MTTPTKTGLALALALVVGCSGSSTPAGGPDGSPPGATVDGSASRDAADGSRVMRSDAADAGSPARPDATGDGRVDAPSPRDATGDVRVDAPSPRDATGLAETGVADAPPATGDARDARPAADAADASPASAILSLGACLGASRPLTISGQMPYVDVPVGSEAGEFVLDFASTYSSIDLSAFAAPGPATSGCNAALLGVVCTVQAFAFFSAPGSVTLTTESFAGVTGSVRQAGIIGTDFLSEQVFTVDYAAATVYAAASACSASALAAAGFAPLSTAGFYENNLSLLEPATDVQSGAPASWAVPNVPTVPVHVAGASAVAQLDTGFDDSVTPFSVNINQAFYAAIVAAAPGALVRDSALDATLSTCVAGVSEPVKAYRLAAGVTFDFIQTGGAAARSYPQAVLFEKVTPAAASSCGGIGTWTSPAAQVAASFYVDMKALVFDPFGAKVWVPKR